MVRARLMRGLRAFHKDETGDEGVNKILIIAMIVVPLVIVLIIFGEEIVDFFQSTWDDLRDNKQMDNE